jgi:hypothetical protein
MSTDALGESSQVSQLGVRVRVPRVEARTTPSLTRDEQVSLFPRRYPLFKPEHQPYAGFGKGFPVTVTLEKIRYTSLYKLPLGDHKLKLHCLYPSLCVSCDSFCRTPPIFTS